MILVENLVKRYKKVLALDHFSFSSNTNEIIGLLGPNGCGKTTAINCMLSLLSFDKGRVQLFGEDVNPNNNAIKEKIGIVPQELAFFEKLNVTENIDFFCGLYVSNNKERQALVEEAIQFVGLEKYRKFMPKQLSGGLKRRLNIACGIAHKPQIIFLDEPTVAVDAQSRNFMLEGIKKMKDDGCTIVYTTHYLEEAEMLCDRLVIMDNGRSVASGTLSELQRSISADETINIKLLDTASNFADKVRSLENVIDVKKTGETYQIHFKKGNNNLSEFIHFIEREGIVYSEFSSEKPSLSDVYLELTGKELRD